MTNDDEVKAALKKWLDAVAAYHEEVSGCLTSIDSTENGRVLDQTGIDRLNALNTDQTRYGDEYHTLAGYRPE